MEVLLVCELFGYFGLFDFEEADGVLEVLFFLIFFGDLGNVVFV